MAHRPKDGAPVSDTTLRLRRPRLRPFQLGGVALVAAALSGAVFAVTPLQGRADFLLVTYLLYVVGQSALSYVVEGRRHAANRLATTLILTAVFAAVLPLVAV